MATQQPNPSTKTKPGRGGQGRVQDQGVRSAGRAQEEKADEEELDDEDELDEEDEDEAEDEEA